MLQLNETTVPDVPAIGLDVGTSRVVSARRPGREFEYRSELNSFVSLPASRLTESVLRKEGIPHTSRNGEIIVHGNECEKFADLLEVEPRRPMSRGVLNSGEPESLAMIREIVAGVLGKPRAEKQRVCFSVPAAPAGGDDNLTYHEASLRQIVSDLGFEPQSISEGLAVVYGEMESSNYTGIGISFGGGLCNVCMAYLSVPVISFSIPKAGDFIDSSAASVTGDLANRIRMAKETSFYLNGHFADKAHQVLGVYYDDVIQTVVASLKEAFANARSLPRLGRPLPLVLSGGSAMPKGFRDRFEKILRESNCPIPVSEIRLAEQPLYSTAKGALVAALSDLGETLDSGKAAHAW
jgi:hypothetical protein